MRAVGIERVTLGTDFGQASNEPPAAGMQTFADALFAAFEQAYARPIEVRRMNLDPEIARLSALSAQSTANELLMDQIVPEPHIVILQLVRRVIELERTVLELQQQVERLESRST